MTKNFFKESSYIGKKRQGNSHVRWTEVELKYNKVKGRIFDKIPAAVPSSHDYDPMYSSFSACAKFVPPLSSKDTLSR